MFLLSAALDAGAAFTVLVIFVFLGAGISAKLQVVVPSWWGQLLRPWERRLRLRPTCPTSLWTAAVLQVTSGSQELFKSVLFFVDTIFNEHPIPK